MGNKLGGEGWPILTDVTINKRQDNYYRAAIMKNTSKSKDADSIVQSIDDMNSSPSKLRAFVPGDSIMVRHFCGSANHHLGPLALIHG